jgi:polyphenol oxidase
MNKNYLQFKIFEKSTEIDCRFYGKTEIDSEIEDKAIFMEQLHGSNVLYLGENFQGKVVKEADGLITQKKEIYIAVKVADCVPIFFFAPCIKYIGICHSGWKGTLLGIPGKVVKTLHEKGADLSKIKCVIGPSICEKCYKVNESRVAEFKKAFSEFKFAKDTLNLKDIVRRELENSGVDPKNIEVSNFCTKCDHDKFYSFRGGDGQLRNIGIIGLIY